MSKVFAHLCTHRDVSEQWVVEYDYVLKLSCCDVCVDGSFKVRLR